MIILHFDIKSAGFLRLKVITDINECYTGLHDCDENAVCNNTIGSFTCSCKSSFFGNGRECRSKKDNIINFIIGYQLHLLLILSQRAFLLKSVVSTFHVRTLLLLMYLLFMIIIVVRPNINLSYAIGTDFCLEDADSLPNGIFVHCPITNAAIPHPHFLMTVIRAAADGTEIEQLLSEQMDHLSLDRTTLSALFDNDTTFVKITCNVSNIFGSDNRTTTIRVCGKC